MYDSTQLSFSQESAGRGKRTERLKAGKWRKRGSGGLRSKLWKCIGVLAVAAAAFTPVGKVWAADDMQKTMYLTFDDGPHKENTSRVLDILKERNVKATFFVVGENVRKYPELTQRIVTEGHAIGIHCTNHDYKALYQSVDSYVRDFEEAHQAVLEVTGVDTKLFRFPGGSVNAYNERVRDAVIDEMTNRGYIYYDWNASLEDAVKNPQPEQLIANGVDSTLGRKKVIMLAHDVVFATGDCLEDLLDRLQEYSMEILTEEVEPIHFSLSAD